MNDARDPFAEEEVTFKGPQTPHTAATNDQDDNLFDDAYDLDSEVEDEFDFDQDEPGEWTPPINPDKSGGRQFAGDAPVASSPRPARRVEQPSGPGDLIFDANLVLEPQSPPQPTPKPEPIQVASQAPTVAPVRPAPRTPAPRSAVQAPEAGKAPKKSFAQKMRSLFFKEDTSSTQTVHSLQRSLNGSVNIVMINRKGGVGKTLVTTLAGMVLASHRKDRIIAVDASPEGGELGDRVEREQNGTVGSLLDQLDSVSRYSHVRTHTSQDQSGLEVLASEPQKPISSGQEYRELMTVLRKFYPVILTDCAQGLKSELMESVLEEADVLVLVSEGTDGMKAATQVANDLVDSQGLYGDRFAALVDDMVVVVNHRSPKTNVDTGQVMEFFSSVAREAISLPYDQMFEGGRAFTLDEISPETRDAAIKLGAAIVNSAGFMEGGR